jgi:hypothetical protein
LALLGLAAWAAFDITAASPERSIPVPARVALRVELAPWRQPVAWSPNRSVRVVSGETIKRFALTEPGGVIRLLRVVAPHRTRATVTAVIPHLANVSISTPDNTIASETCERRGAVDVCTQAEEACPMPAATWRFRLTKLAGPAGVVRIEFVIRQARAA